MTVFPDACAILTKTAGFFDLFCALYHSFEGTSITAFW